MHGIQDLFLAGLCKAQIPSAIFLMNGIRLYGTITGFDIHTIYLHDAGITQIVYKHAIASVLPQEGVIKEGKYDASSPLNTRARKNYLSLKQ